MDITRETRTDLTLPVPNERRARFDARLRRAEDFLLASLRELDALEGGAAGAALLDHPREAWVATYERSSGRGAEPAAGGVPPILVVDLEESSREAMGSLLRTTGYPVLEAGSSSDVPAAAEITPQLIVFDPGRYLDAALRTVARMRIQQAAPVPVVLISAEFSPEMRSRALGIGCAEVLRKGCPPVQLLTVIGSLLGPAPLAD
ncbi:MAG TPA: response regulator [Longimicrobium sp.]|nr:response regulator [Longimicrobium sp.]